MFEILRRRTSAVLLVTALAAGCGGGGGGGDNPPAAVDILDGAGSFETEADQAQWNVQTSVTVNEDLWSACDSGSTCAKIELSDYGANAYDAQLALWDLSVDPTTFKTVTLTSGKFYTIKLWAMAVNPADEAGTTHPISVWLQKTDYSGNFGEGSFEVGAAGSVFETEGFTFDGTTGTESNLVINFGPQDTNGGTTFYIDDFEVLESEPPPPPDGVDLFSGLGSFDDADAQSHWWIQIQGGADATVEYVTEAGFDGQCAKITGNTGATNYYTQFGWADPENPGDFATVYLDPTKMYQIRAKTKVVGAASEPITLSAWLQPGSDPSVNGWGGAAADLVYTSEATERVLGTFAGNDSNPQFKINFGTADTAEGGVDFFIDDVRLVEVTE